MYVINNVGWAAERTAYHKKQDRIFEWHAVDRDRIGGKANLARSPNAPFVKLFTLHSSLFTLYLYSLLFTL
jgi:hypothetical protein